MDVLQTCIRFPPAPGGAETHVLEISKLLKARDYNVTVFTSDLYKEVPFTRKTNWEPKIQGIPVQRFRAFSMPGELHYIFIPSLAKAILKVKTDLIHAHSYGYFQVNISGLNKRLRDTPFVLTPHFHPPWSMWGGDRRKQLRKIYDKIFAPAVLNAVDRIIGVSHHEMELLQEIIKIDPDKIRYIPNGIDFSRFQPVPKPDEFLAKYKPKGNIILYVGRLASNKGLEVLIKAAPQVLSDHPKTTFVFVGEDEGMKGALVSQAKKLGISQNILFTGHIKDEGLFLSAFAACDVFVLPSEYEAFGIVLLEAMACKKPVIGTHVGGVPEAIGDEGAGVVVEYNDAKALAKEINRLLADKNLTKKMGAIGRKRVKKNFTWESVVDQIEQVYAELI
ncbi:glycosyltransferase family 4 protein [[Eubacterium] cellulosolvens]